MTATLTLTGIGDEVNDARLFHQPLGA